MEHIPLVSSSIDLCGEVRRIAEVTVGPGYTVVFLETAKSALEYLAIEMPHYFFLDFSSEKIDGFEVLENVLKDPWLMSGGIIAICDDRETFHKINGFQGANIIVILYRQQLENRLGKIFQLIHSNKRILFQRQFDADLIKNFSGSFFVGNDFIEATCFANLVINFLFNTNKIGIDQKSHLNLCLIELLYNAIEHGNCGISFSEKSHWLEEGNSILDLIEKKCQDPDVASRRVTFDFSIGMTHSHFSIGDEGQGFDWKKTFETMVNTQDLGLLHGRGIQMTENLVQNLRFNELGNQVQFNFAHNTDAVNTTPGLFEDIPPEKIPAGSVVFEQGEASNYLYFIVKGRYLVEANGKQVSTLSADDIFLGEMSFLMGDQRTATVQAISDGELIKIAKQDFIAAIRKKPHYALFLCRLLAQRINRANQRV